MAIMLPDMPKTFDPKSREGDMFAALMQLSDDYYVFHSFKINTVENNVVYESETDFVIFNPNLGIICLEAKAGKVSYKDGNWFYASGDKMSGEGPFTQADRNKWKLMKYFENSKVSTLKDKCKFLHAVWFPSIDETLLRTMTLPADCDNKLILTREALDNPTPYIERIFSIELPNRCETSLTKDDANRILKTVLCPNFDIFPSSTFEVDIKKIAFHRLIREQAHILNFLTEQRTAIINGAAGTGKTVIAVQKAFREANKGDKVLFLCYNKYLKEYLERQYPHENISYYTIDGFGCKICRSSKCDYYDMGKVLEEIYCSLSFPYKHIVIDEGQDFGIEDINDNNIVEHLRDIILDLSEDGTFYIFYDKLQLIQVNSVIPDFISDADCKLTLYKNCRNTMNIATTSLAPISERKAKINDETRNVVSEDTVNIYFGNEDSVKIDVDNIICKMEDKGYRDIVILSPKTNETSILSKYLRDGKYKNYNFSTCRKFKGLEADAILFVDLDKDTFKNSNRMLFYVGASRARFALNLYSVMSEEDCEIVLRDCFDFDGKIKKPRRELSKKLKTHFSAI